MRTPLYTIRADTVSSTVTIIGKASAGADENAPVWRLLKLTDDGFTVSTKYVDGLTGFNYKWADRLSYTYL